MKLLQHYLLCMAALLLLFSAYCRPFIYQDLNSIAESMTISPEIEDKSSSFSNSKLTAKAFSKDIAAPTRIIKPGILTYPTHYFYPRIKYLISGYPFKDVSPFILTEKTFKVGRIFYTDTVLKGGVWQGAFIGCLGGIGVASSLLLGFNSMFSTKAPTSLWVQTLGWGILNGSGIGGLAGFGRQRKKQRQLNQQYLSLPY